MDPSPAAPVACEPGSREQTLEALVALESLTRGTSDLNELSFLVANDTHSVVSYYQGVVWQLGAGGRTEVLSVSGVAALDRTSTALRDVRKIVRSIARNFKDGAPVSLDAATFDGELRTRWKQYFPRHALWQPFKGEDGAVVGGLLLTRKDQFSDEEDRQVRYLADSYSRQWQWLTRRSLAKRLAPRFELSRLKTALMVGAAIMVLGLIVRIPAAVTGQAEIVAKDPLLIAAPVDGAIESFVVRPNAVVNQGDTLLRFRDVDLRNAMELSNKSLMVAIADYERSRQKALTDKTEAGEVKLYRLTVEQKKAEVAFAQARLERAQMIAPISGVALFSNPNDLIGKPLSMGERIMTIANPQDVQVQVWVPVDAMVDLEPGASVKVFLDTSVGGAVTGVLERSSFEPELSPRGALAFRLEASIDAGETLPRLGSSGSARVYSEKVSVVYYLIRRPLARVVQWLGF